MMTLHLTLCVMMLLSVVSQLDSTPVSSNHATAQGASLDTIRGIIMELENVLYKLKDYARELQASNSGRSRDSFLGDLADLDADDLQLTANSKSQQQSIGSRPRVPSSDLSKDDLSLREALEYLVGLAKQKKLERRDHDIPFPFVDREGN